MAMFLGTSSPYTIDSNVATIIAKTSDTAGAALPDNPTSSNAGVKYRAKIGSAK